MIIIYKIVIQIVNLFLPVAGLFNNKIKKGISGRKKTLEYLSNNIDEKDNVFWFHCASLGEYEQGLPVFESLKKAYPNVKIILSFLSPSGYEIRKENPITSHVIYLPLDTSKNVKLFLKITSPKLVVFVKYELWPNYLKALKHHPSKVYLISALFRPKQIYFNNIIKSYGKILLSFDHIFTQNKDSKKLLESIGCKSITVTNDTRYDRVLSQLKKNNVLPFIEKFKGDSLCLIAGSTWPEDIEIILPVISKLKKKIKFIIAPHKIENQEILKLKKKLGDKTELYSTQDTNNIDKKQILIVDCVGILTKLYSYADLAYVGGGMGNSGLHNILEAAVFSTPIIIGKNFSKFPEAKALISIGGVTSIDNSKNFISIIDRYLQSKQLRKETGIINKNYIDLNKGASSRIVRKIKADLND